MRLASVTILVVFALGPAAAQGVSPPFTQTERVAILAHGPWPPPATRDPSNRVSGNVPAIALGRTLFFDKRLSREGNRSCATCHNPAKSFSDGRTRSIGRRLHDRNAIALANLAQNRWFGWAGAADSLWAQSIRPILDEKELALTPDMLRQRISANLDTASHYLSVFGVAPAADDPERVLVNVAKALAAYQETLVTGRTPFDDFRDALERNDHAAQSRYPLPAQRGLRIFVGNGRCAACHFGPNFTTGEFEDIGIPFFAEKGRVDAGRHGGIGALRTSPYNLLGPYNDDMARSTAVPTQHVEPLHRNWGEFRVPSLRNVARTAPYMHNGSLPTLAAVVRHYSELDEERLHGTPDKRLLKPLRLSKREKADLIAFLRTLSSEVHAPK